MYENAATYIVVFLLAAIVVFLITREFWTWYWKINEVLSTLKKIEQKIGQAEVQSAPSSGVTASEPTPALEKNIEVSKIISDRYAQMSDGEIKSAYERLDQYNEENRAAISREFRKRRLS